MTARPIVRTFFDEPTFTASHVVHDPATKAAAIIDSVLDIDNASGRTSTKAADEIIAYVKAEGLKVEWILSIISFRTTRLNALGVGFLFSTITLTRPAINLWEDRTKWRTKHGSYF